jgi:hypothetical protein
MNSEFMNGRLVENSNFVKAHKLQWHQRYTFVQAGKDGYACSEPSNVEGIDILKEIHRMLDESTRFENNVQFLNGLAKDIKMVVEELVRGQKDSLQFEKTWVFPSMNWEAA